MSRDVQLFRCDLMLCYHLRENRSMLSLIISSFSSNLCPIIDALMRCPFFFSPSPPSTGPTLLIHRPHRVPFLVMTLFPSALWTASSHQASFDILCCLLRFSPNSCSWPLTSVLLTKKKNRQLPTAAPPTSARSKAP